MAKNLIGRLCARPASPRTIANQAGMDVVDDSQGRFRIKDKVSGAHIGTYTTEREAKEALTKLINQNVPDLDGGFSIPFKGEAGASNGPRIGDQPAFFSRENLLSLQAGPLAVLTPIKQYAQAVEQLGFGKAYTGVYDKLQNARVTINRHYAFEKRSALRTGNKDRTFNERLLALDARSAKLDPEQRRLATLYREAYTKPEIATALGLDDFDRQAARTLEKLGVAEDIPTIHRTNALIDDFLDNRKKVVDEVIPRLRIEVLEGRLPQEMLPRLQRLAEAAGDDVKDLVSAMKHLGMTGEEQQAAVYLRAIMDMEIPEAVADQFLRGFAKPQGKLYNLPALYRYATSPELKEGFKSGRAQFAAERGMTGAAIEVGEDSMDIIRVAYEGSGFDPDLLVGIQYPVFRQFIDAGFYPGRQYGQASSGSINRYASVLGQFEEASEVFTRRVLSGHLNPYELHPSVTANKHVRNMLFREHFDDLAREAKSVVKTIPDQRAREIMTDYIHAVEGLPNAGFDRLNSAFRTMARFIGARVDDQLADRTISLLTKTASQAAIPLRAGLVLRNYVTQNLLVASIVGADAWTHGLQMAAGKGFGGYNAKNLRSAVSEAIKHGVIDPNTIPLHAHSEIFGFNVARIGGANAQPVIAQAQNMADKLFDSGFSLYRSGDDWGRTVAFFAGRHRVNKHVSAFVNSDKSPAALETFKRNAKVKTFHEAIEAQFDDLVMAGRFVDAEVLIGKQLADKTHFLYGNANHPAGWGGPIGRLFGQFGTFPTQYLQMITEGVTRGTVKDRVEFATTHSLVNMGIIFAGHELLDADLRSWSTFGSIPALHYMGGPYADIALNLAAASTGNDAQKSLAVRSLRMALPSLDNPASVFVPGSYFFSDLWRATQEDEFSRIVLRGIGIRPLDRPIDWVDDALAWLEDTTSIPRR